jgi:hypothetical protein
MLKNPHVKEYTMPARTPKETFLILLSHVRDATEKGTKIYDEFTSWLQVSVA